MPVKPLMSDHVWKALITKNLTIVLVAQIANFKTETDHMELWCIRHYIDVIMRAMTSQPTSLTIVYSTVYSGTDERKYQGSSSLAFVRGNHRSPHKGTATRKMFPFDDIIIIQWVVSCKFVNAHMMTRKWEQVIRTISCLNTIEVVKN